MNNTIKRLIKQNTLAITN